MTNNSDRTRNEIIGSTKRAYIFFIAFSVVLSICGCSSGDRPAQETADASSMNSELSAQETVTDDTPDTASELSEQELADSNPFTELSDPLTPEIAPPDASDVPPTQETIISDIRDRTNFSNLGIEVDEFTIIKRKTNTEDGVDEVYVGLAGSNESFRAVRYYRLVYELYNEGWLCENVEEYLDNTYFATTTPFQWVTEQDAYSFLKSIDLNQFASESSDVHGVEIVDVSLAAEIIERNYREFCATARYTYYCYDEIVQIPVAFQFTANIDENCYWEQNLRQIQSRTAELNEGIIGYWSYLDEWFSQQSDQVGCIVDITSYTANECVVGYYWRGFSGSTEYISSGTMGIDYGTRDDGRLASVHLDWNDGLDHEGTMPLWLNNLDDYTIYSSDYSMTKTDS